MVSYSYEHNGKVYYDIVLILIVVEDGLVHIHTDDQKEGEES